MQSNADSISSYETKIGKGPGDTVRLQPVLMNGFAASKGMWNKPTGLV